MSRPAALAARGLTFRYRTTTVLADFDADFHAETLTAVTGPSGCGKSTLLYLLGLMLRPAAGQVSVRGVRVDNGSDARRADLRAADFGFVFQDAVLDPTRSILDNVLETTLYRRADRGSQMAEALALLARFGVAERPRRRPGQISGGQAQRVALCRALLADPPILLADEPTGNLDVASGAMVLDALRGHARAGGAVLVATHDPVVVAACDVHLVLGQP